MRILRVVSDLYPTVVGGIGIHAHEMSRIQSEKGNDVTVLTFCPKKSTPIKNQRYQIIQIPFLFKLWGNTFSFTLPFLILKIIDNFDIIHAHSHLFFSTNVCAFIRKFKSTPLVITNHGIMSASAPDWFNILYLKTLGKWTLNTADKILCYTDEEKEKLVTLLHINKSKIIVVPNGVDTDQFHPRLKKNSINTTNLLWVGRFVKGKGVEYLIQSMSTLVKDNPDLHLTLIGDGPGKGSICEFITDLGLDNHVKIIEFVPYDKIPEIFQNSDIFVLPSLYEGVPRTVLEAMSCGIPVVISQFTHLEGLIDGGGQMFPKMDVEALSTIIKEIINNPGKKAEMGRNAREKIVRDYSFMRTVTQTLDVYDDIIACMN